MGAKHASSYQAHLKVHSAHLAGRERTIEAAFTQAVEADPRANAIATFSQHLLSSAAGSTAARGAARVPRLPAISLNPLRHNARAEKQCAHFFAPVGSSPLTTRQQTHRTSTQIDAHSRTNYFSSPSAKAPAELALSEVSDESRACCSFAAGPSPWDPPTHRNANRRR